MSEYILKSYNTYHGYSNVDNLPSAVGKAGYLRYDKDTGIKWRSNGSIWVRTDIPAITQYGYSAIIYKSGSNYIADQADGTNISTNTNGTTVGNDAITYCNGLTNGGVVLLAPNTTLSISLALTMLSNVVLRGCGKSSIINVTAAVDGIDCIGTSGSHKSNILIEYLKLTGTSVVGTQTRGIGIAFDYTDDSIVRNCEITGFGGNTGGSDDAGIRIRRGSRINLYGNYCHDNINGILTGTTNSPNVYEAIDCHIEHNRCRANFNDGIHSQISQRIIINGNTCNDNLESGIDLLGDEFDTVSTNICKGNTHSGIEIGNSLSSTGNPDRFHTVIGNTCCDNTLNGCQLLAKVEDCTITGNNFSRNTQSGVILGGGSTSAINRNMISSNICKGNSQRGIYLTNGNVDHNVVMGNLVNGNAARGIYLVNAGNGDPTNNLILNNRSYGNTTSDITDSVVSTTNTLSGNFTT